MVGSGATKWVGDGVLLTNRVVGVAGNDIYIGWVGGLMDFVNAVGDGGFYLVEGVVKGAGVSSPP